VGILAHEAPDFAVDARQAVDGLLVAGPVLGVLVGEVVGHGPDAEVGVVRDERDGGRALLGRFAANKRMRRAEEDFIGAAGSLLREVLER
jgi:uncharacterized protein YcfJ